MGKGLAARPQERISAPNYVIEQIKQALIDGSLNPGDRLPSEPELETLYGVSRGSVRQAMKSLEILGVVSIRPGDGTYVNETISKNNLNPLVFSFIFSQASTQTITDARYALERDIAEMILSDNERIERVIPQLKENILHHEELHFSHAGIEELVDNDQAFHRILSQCCDNVVIKTVYDYILDAFRKELIMTTTLQQDSNYHTTIRDHTAILHAIESRDFSQVKQAISDSLQNWGGMMDQT
ncbi:MAG: FadR family transcriptional regulator [Clostridium sp.]|nr:FadR family transcriptional regulator [Clostridium sp.]